MFPLADGRRAGARVPWVTYGLLALNALAFVYLLTLRDAPWAPFCSDLEESAQAVRRAAGSVQGFVCRYGAIPDELHRGRDLVTGLTALFVHGGWLHLIGNMLFLRVFGDNVEDALGPAAFLALYLAGGLMAQAAHVAYERFATDPSYGASGAIAAVLGAYLLVIGRNQVRVLIGPFPFRLPAALVIGVWAVQQLVATYRILGLAEYSGATAYEAHVAGIATGLAVGAVARWRLGGPVAQGPLVAWTLPFRRTVPDRT